MISIFSNIWSISIDVIKLIIDAYKNINVSTQKRIITTPYHTNKELKLINESKEIKNIPRCVFDTSLEESYNDNIK